MSTLEVKYKAAKLIKDIRNEGIYYNFIELSLGIRNQDIIFVRR